MKPSTKLWLYTTFMMLLGFVLGSYSEFNKFKVISKKINKLCIIDVLDMKMCEYLLKE